MNRLPTGMYLPGDSLIHKLDPRVKLLGLFISVIAIILVRSLIGYGIILVFLALTVALSGISIKIALNSVQKLSWFFLVIFLMNTFFYSPENAWFSWWIFKPSPAGLMQGIDVVFALFCTGCQQCHYQLHSADGDHQRTRSPYLPI